MTLVPIIRHPTTNRFFTRRRRYPLIRRHLRTTLTLHRPLYTTITLRHPLYTTTCHHRRRCIPIPLPKGETA